MSKLTLTGALLVAAALSAAPAVAQFAPIISPAPDGLEEGEGAGFTKGNFTELDNLPDWGGIWFVKFGPPAPDAAPPSKPQPIGEYIGRHDAWVKEVSENDGQVLLDRSNCSPPGVPRLMQLAQYPFEFLFTPGRVTVNQEAWMQTRTIWTDGRDHPEDPDPTFNGHSIGHWEGDTLVVDTIGIGDFLDIERGYYHSDKFHMVERIKISDSDPDVLELKITVDDAEALAAPHSISVNYNRDRNGQLIEFQCSENDRNTVDADGVTRSH